MLKHMIRAAAIGVAVVALSQPSFVSVGTGVPLVAATRSQQAASSAAGQPPQANMAEMMKMHQQMIADLKAADAKLDELVKAMNAASGEAKVTAIAQVVNELVRQQKSMHEHMETMGHEMMMRMGGRGMMNKQ